MPPILSPEQQRIIEHVAEGHNVFVTGGAGTGKSFILNVLRETYGTDLQVTASTGIAAVQVGGITLHSWANLHLGQDPIELTVKKIMRNGKIKKRVLEAKLLAIDEISMIKADLFNKFNEVMKKVRQSDEPFGGLQILLFGDFLQLPPVTEWGSGEQNYFCFESEAWTEGNFKNVMLRKIFRQEDDRFVELLNYMRFGIIKDHHWQMLQDRLDVEDTDDSIEPTIITTHNQQADRINAEKLAAIDGKVQAYNWTEWGDKTKLRFLTKYCLASETLELKIGAQVMMLKNNFQEEGIVNGSLGVVSDFSEDNFPIVSFNNGVEKEIRQAEWTIDEYDPTFGDMQSVASITQLPLRLAWAITVHKSQGMTLDKIKCQLNRAFSEGQIYVALSRVKSLEGLYLDQFSANLVRVHPKVVNFYVGLKKMEEGLNKIFDNNDGSL